MHASKCTYITVCVFAFLHSLVIKLTQKLTKITCRLMKFQDFLTTVEYGLPEVIGLST